MSIEASNYVAIMKQMVEALQDLKDDCSVCEFEWQNDYPLQCSALESGLKAIARAEGTLEAEQGRSPDKQEPVAYGMWDTQLGRGSRMMMVRLDKGQDGCTVPLYVAHGITSKGKT